MQNITFYARAAETLGAFTDYANAKTKPAPILTRGVAVCLQMRLFKEDGSLDPVPIDTFADVKAWQWVMDDDFDSTSNYILVAQHDKITVEAKTEEIEGESREITEFTIPIPEMNTEELDAVLQKKENVANLNGELVGLNGAGEAVYILQLKGFTVRNRISSAGNPTPITAEYYTAVQTRAIIAGTNAYELARNAEFHIGDRAYYPGEPGYLLICAAEGTSAADLPKLDKTVNSFLDGTVTWQVYDLSKSGGGAANITVNGVSPDAKGNIELTARWVPMPEVTENGERIIQSSVCGSQDLEQFYERLQSVVFNIDGNTVNTQEDSDGYYYTGEVDLKYYVESPDWSWIVQCIAYDYGDGQVDVEQHYYLHTQIHEILDKYSAYCVNGYGAGEYNKGEIWLDAGRIPYARNSSPDDYNTETIMDHMEAIDYSAFFYPDYYGMTNVDTETGNAYVSGVTYMAPSNGWLIIEWCSYDMQDDSYVEIDGRQFQLGTVNEKGGSTYRQFIFPIGAWSNWSISDDECRSYTIRFLPCIQFYSTGE